MMAFLRDLRYGLRVLRRDRGFTAAAVALLGLVAFVACYRPARRATRIDPRTSLRCE